ncbi:histidine phosphatase family protein [Peribacillus saganii]|uniref:Histidine phosphatase family protein n=1 Tax=Peribacillus saganii TaxID=2303992 RepID=A0A372LLU7_9BACI|nr:histidine phosphatase family protein [Peribacillus saganii]RFU67907.1 histidine phosphatase family protein [Peribacillus saganii]
MKVGLLRHFKVTRGYPNKIVTSEELRQWMREYDASDVEENRIDLCNVDWSKCYASDLSRAEKTARKAFDGQIIFLEELREIPLSPFFQRKIRLPLPIHLLFIRIAWLFNHKSQSLSKKDVSKRINVILDKVLQQDENVLIVSHGGIMMFMRKELLKRGFTGPKFRTADNGKLYIFEK